MNMERFTTLYQLNGCSLERVFYKEDDGVLDLCIRAGEGFSPGLIPEGKLLTLHFTDVSKCSVNRRKCRCEQIIYTEALSDSQIYLETNGTDRSCNTLYIHAADVRVLPVAGVQFPFSAAIA